MASTPKSKTERERERRTEFLSVLEPYVRERLLLRMRIPDAGASLELPPHGERSTVLLLSAGDREMVVRCFPRRSDRVKTARAVRHSRRRGVPVPAVLHVDRSRAARRRLGCSLLVEERVPGLHAFDFPDRDRMLGIVAGAISRMHNVTRRRWGNLRIGRRAGYFRRLMGTLGKHFALATGLGSDLEAKHGGRIAGWLDRFERKVRRIPRYSFSHKSVASDNVVISPEGDLVFIDVQRLSYEHFAANVVKARATFCLTEIEKAHFTEEYFAAAVGRDRGEFREWRDFFHVLHLVRTLGYACMGRARDEGGVLLADRIEERILAITGTSMVAGRH